MTIRISNITEIQQLTIGLIAAVVCLLSCQPAQSDREIVIACAANAYPAMEEICRKFTARSGEPCRLVTGSSGKLTSQILEGAPYDLLVSADMFYPEKVRDMGFAESDPTVYAYGKLVLWSNLPEIRPEIYLLSSDSIRNIAIANPKTAPYGKAAAEALNWLELSEIISDKLVYGESVTQTNQFIFSGTAELGITSLSSVKLRQEVDTSDWIILPEESYQPIKQGIVLLKHSGKPGNKANEFYQFVFSDNARKILLKYGYSVDE